MSLYKGIYYFGTISAETDYRPSDKMLNAMKKKFKDFLHIVIEHGESGKEHCHWVGISEVRTDNLKNSLRKILEADGVDLSNYTLDLRPEPNINWRVGYLCKEADHIVVYTTLGEATLEQCKLDYDAKPKRDRGLKQEKCMSYNQLADYLEDAGIYTREGVLEALKVLKREKKINFAFFQKLNVKKLILYMTERFDD